MTLYFFAQRVAWVWCAFFAIAHQPIHSLASEKTLSPNSISITCPADLTIAVFGSNCAATVQLPLPSVQMLGCSGNPTFHISTPFGNGLGPHPNVTVGDYTITYAVSSPCGDSALCTYRLSVVDKRNPTPILVNALYTNLQANGEVKVRAWQFNQNSFDNCSSGTELEFSFSAQKNDTLRTYFCGDVGIQNLEITVHDKAGNTVTRPVKLSIQDVNGNCRDGKTLGKVTHSCHPFGVAEVHVKAVSGASVHATETGTDGNFYFEGLDTALTYRITAYKNDDHLAGVDMYDLFLMQQYILGTRIFPTPFHRIAADINGDGVVSSTDLQSLQSVLIGFRHDFPNNTSWRFLDKNFTFSNQNNPWETTFPEFVDRKPQASAPVIGFSAVKVGDLNPDAHLARGGAGDRSSAAVSCQIRMTKIASGEIEVSLELPRHIAAAEGFINFPVGIHAVFSKNESTGIHFSNEKKSARFGWIKKQEQEITIQFTVEAGRDMDVQGLTDALVSAEWTGFDADGHAFSFDFDEAASVFSAFSKNNSAEFSAVTVQPNPMISGARLSFQQEISGEIQLRILNALGTEVASQRMATTIGHQEILLERDFFPTSGLYFIHLNRVVGNQVLRLVVE